MRSFSIVFWLFSKDIPLFQGICQQHRFATPFLKYLAFFGIQCKFLSFSMKKFCFPGFQPRRQTVPSLSMMLTAGRPRGCAGFFGSLLEWQFCPNRPPGGRCLLLSYFFLSLWLFPSGIVCRKTRIMRLVSGYGMFLLQRTPSESPKRRGIKPNVSLTYWYWSISALKPSYFRMAFCVCILLCSITDTLTGHRWKWNIAVDRDTSKSRFHLDYPFVQPY